MLSTTAILLFVHSIVPQYGIQTFLWVLEDLLYFNHLANERKYIDVLMEVFQ